MGKNQAKGTTTKVGRKDIGGPLNTSSSSKKKPVGEGYKDKRFKTRNKRLV